MTENEIGAQLVDAAIGTHRKLGPGLLETVVELILPGELLNIGEPMLKNGIVLTVVGLAE